MMEVSIDVLLKIWLEKLTSPSGSMLLVNQNLFMKIYKRRLVSSRCSTLYCRAILQTLDGTNTGSKIDEENVLPLLCRRQMDSILVSCIRRINRMPCLLHLLCTG